uniref:Uncharacterized protein n=1 Tax=Anas platyrhynchos TaxID=8839 RepID=A0A8B9QWG8_ANAPL
SASHASERSASSSTPASSAASAGSPGTKAVLVKLRYQRSALRAKVCGCTVYLGRCSFPYSRSFSSTDAASCTCRWKCSRRRRRAALLLAVCEATTGGYSGPGGGGGTAGSCDSQRRPSRSSSRQPPGAAISQRKGAGRGPAQGCRDGKGAASAEALLGAPGGLRMRRGLPSGFPGRELQLPGGAAGGAAAGRQLGSAPPLTWAPPLTRARRLCL